MDLSNFREEYLKGQLHRKDLAANPFEQFQTWFDQAATRPAILRKTPRSA